MSSTLDLARRIKDGATLPQRCPNHSQHERGCDACKQLARIRSRARHQAASYGWLQPSKVPAGEARKHINLLVDQHDMTLSLIAEQAGVSFSTAQRIADGTTTNSHPRTVNAILAVRPTPPPPPHGLKLSVGSARRLQGLACAQYSSDDLSPMLNALPEVVRRWRNGKNPMISVTWHDAIRALADTLDGTRGSSSRAARHALRLGWVPLAAWDDIDDPDASPHRTADDSGVVDDVAIEMALQGQHPGRLTTLEKHHAVRRGIAAGMSVTAVSIALRISGRTARQFADCPLPDYELAA